MTKKQTQLQQDILSAAITDQANTPDLSRNGWVKVNDKRDNWPKDSQFVAVICYKYGYTYYNDCETVGYLKDRHTDAFHNIFTHFYCLPNPTE